MVEQAIPVAARRHWLIFAAGLLLMLAIVSLALFHWNWLKPMLEAQTSAAMGRPVHITSLRVDLRWQPVVHVEGFRVGNPPGLDGPDLASIDDLAIEVKPWPLLRGKLVFPSVTATRPKVHAERRADGTGNYVIQLAGEGGGTPPEIGALNIIDGRVRFIDAMRRTDIELAVDTMPDPKGGEPIIVAVGKGKYDGNPATLNFRGGSLLSLRAGLAPYPLSFEGSVGETKIKLAGTIRNPATLDGADVRLDLAGPSMSRLDAIIGIPIPPTPPYKVSGRFDIEGKTIRYRAFSGVVGDSDLSGDLIVELGGARPHLRGKMVSKKVVLADLAGFIGAPPGREEKGGVNAEHATVAAAAKASGRLLPVQPINLAKLRSIDVDVTYAGQRIESDYTPLDNLSADLQIVDGQVQLKPLRFGMGQGEIRIDMKLDGRTDPAPSETRMLFRNIDLKRIMQETKSLDGAGAIAGALNLKTTGNSISAMLGRGDGQFQLFMGGGSFSTLLLEIIGLDATEALGVVLERADRQAVIRCMVADFALQQGVLNSRAIVFDTSDTIIFGKGSIDLRDETLKLRLEPHPKDVSILTLRAPLHITGPLRDPSVLPDLAQAGGRVAAAVVLGLLFTPLAALLPTIETGLGQDSDCKALVTAARSNAAATSVRQPGAKAAIAEPVNPATGEPGTAPKAAPAK